MTQFSDLAMAMRFRDFIRSVVRRELTQSRPLPRYGTCTDFNRVTRTATITWPDSTTTEVKMGAVQPYSVPMVVRVEGVAGNFYISDVAGKAYVDVGP